MNTGNHDITKHQATWLIARPPCNGQALFFLLARYQEVSEPSAKPHFTVRNAHGSKKLRVCEFPVSRMQKMQPKVTNVNDFRWYSHCRSPHHLPVAARALIRHRQDAARSFALKQNLRLDTIVNFARGEDEGNGSTAVPADRIPPFNGRIGLLFEPIEVRTIELFGVFADSQTRLSPHDVRDVRKNSSLSSRFLAGSTIQARPDG